MADTLDDDELNNMSPEELLAKLNKSLKDAEKWDEGHPDPKR